MFADDGDAQNLVFAWHGEHLDKTVGRAVDDRAIQVIEAIAREFIGHALLTGLGFGQTHPRDLGVSKGCPRDDAVVGLETLESPEQRVDRGIPSLVRSGVGELERSCHVTDRVDIGVQGLQEAVGFDGISGRQRNAQFLQTISCDARAAPDCAQQLVEGDREFCLAVAHDQALLAFAHFHPKCLMADQNLDAIGSQRGAHPVADLGILPHHQARRHLDLGDFAAQAGKALRQFAADRASAQHEQALGQVGQAPDRVAGQKARVL